MYALFQGLKQCTSFAIFFKNVYILAVLQQTNNLLLIDVLTHWLCLKVCYILFVIIVFVFYVMIEKIVIGDIFKWIMVYFSHLPHYGVLSVNLLKIINLHLNVKFQGDSNRFLYVTFSSEWIKVSKFMQILLVYLR